MRTTGTTFSAVGHLGLIGWLILGWGFDAEPLDFTTTTVSIVSGEEFEQMTAATTPVPGTADPTVPVPPEVDDASPPTPAVEEPTETAPPPDPVEPPVKEAPPPPAPAAPPVTEVTDTAPVELAPPADPPSTPEVEVTDTPTPQQIDRVTPTPSALPPPDSQVDDVVREDIVPDDSAEPDVVEEEQEPTAPEVAAPEIVIEDETPSGLVETSLRPTARPSRPAPPVVTPEVDTQTAEVDTPTPAQPDPDTSEADVDAALAAALAPAAAPGPPMTGSERDSFRIAVNGCWNVDPGSVAARVIVEVGFSLDREGKVQGEVRLISSDGDQSATNTAFEAARRAILRCQSGGYQLPADKYEQWKDVVITFDPSGMRLR